jgi:hypothetical protein
MKTLTDDNGRHHFAATEKESFYYEKSMIEQGLGRCIGMSTHGRVIEYYDRLEKLTPIAWKRYEWIEPDGERKGGKIATFGRIDDIDDARRALQFYKDRGQFYGGNFLPETAAHFQDGEL